MAATYLAEVHRLYTFGAQCRTDGRRGRSLAGADDELDDLILCESFARHFVVLPYAMRYARPTTFTCDSRRKFQRRNFPKRLLGGAESRDGISLLRPQVSNFSRRGSGCNALRRRDGGGGVYLRAAT